MSLLSLHRPPFRPMDTEDEEETNDDTDTNDIVVYFLNGSAAVLRVGMEPKTSFIFSDSVRISRIMLRCIYGCQKWIPDKILHRNNDPIFFSTFIFSLKKIILKMKNMFFSKTLHGGQRRAF